MVYTWHQNLEEKKVLSPCGVGVDTGGLDPRVYALREIHHIPDKHRKLYYGYTNEQACKDIKAHRARQPVTNLAKIHTVIKKSVWERLKGNGSARHDPREYVLKKVYKMSAQDIGRAMKLFTVKQAIEEISYQHRRKSGDPEFLYETFGVGKGTRFERTNKHTVFNLSTPLKVGFTMGSSGLSRSPPHNLNTTNFGSLKSATGFTPSQNVIRRHKERMASLRGSSPGSSPGWSPGFSPGWSPQSPQSSPVFRPYGLPAGTPEPKFRNFRGTGISLGVEHPQQHHSEHQQHHSEHPQQQHQTSAGTVSSGTSTPYVVPSSQGEVPSFLILPAVSPVYKYIQKPTNPEDVKLIENLGHPGWHKKYFKNSKQIVQKKDKAFINFEFKNNINHPHFSARIQKVQDIQMDDLLKQFGMDVRNHPENLTIRYQRELAHIDRQKYKTQKTQEEKAKLLAAFVYATSRAHEVFKNMNKKQLVEHEKSQNSKNRRDVYIAHLRARHDGANKETLFKQHPHNRALRYELDRIKPGFLLEQGVGLRIPVTVNTATGKVKGQNPLYVPGPYNSKPRGQKKTYWNYVQWGLNKAALPLNLLSGAKSLTSHKS